MEDYHGLKYIRTSDAIDKAKQIIINERSGEQYGLLSRWHGLNVGMLKYFRFNQVTFIVGRSGSGKSFFANMLRQDLLDMTNTYYEHDENIYLGTSKISWEDNPALPEGTTYYPESRMLVYPDKLEVRGTNRRYEFDVVLIHFGFEMAPESEILRTVANIMGISFGELMSSKYNKQFKKYDMLSIEQYECASSIMDSLGKRQEYYVPISGNIPQMDATIDFIANRHPNSKIIISLDHTFLTKKLDENNDSDLVQNLANHAVKWRQTYEAMVIMLNQLNNRIEEESRITKRNLHYPTKADIHFGSQLWWAADNVIAIHRPKLLGINQYGVDKLNTEQLIHLAIIKSRMGVEGNVWLKDELFRSRMLEIGKSYFLPSNQ